MADYDETRLEESSTVLESDATLASDATILQADMTMPAQSVADNIAIDKGEKLLNIYRVESDAIQGGMGKVWRVRHTGWDIDLAMKQPKAELFQNVQQKEDFIHECEAWINLGLHPQIVSCYYVREIGGTPSIFAEWMEGGSLKDWINNGKLYDGDANANIERILDVAIQFGRGLHYAHGQGLIHQDVKPDNLLMTQMGEAKVADFGIARARAVLTAPNIDAGAPEGSTMISGSGAYTPAYCSMEQLNGEMLTRRTDIYSWAVSVLEMFLGERLWQSGIAAGEACEDYFSMDMRAAMPQGMKELLRHCFAMNPDERPHDFGEIDAVLLQIYREVTGKTYPSEISKAAADTPDSLNNRALSLLDLGKPQEAEELWKRALSIDTEHLDSSYNLILYAWRNSRSDDHNLLYYVNRHLAKEPEKTNGLLEQIKKEQYGLEVLRSIGGDQINLITLAAVTSDGDTILAYLSVLDRFQAYNAQTGETIGVPLENDRGAPIEIRFTHSGNGFWAMYKDSLLLRSFPDGESICEIAQENFPVIAYGIDQQEKYIVTLSWHERKLTFYAIPTVTTWDLKTGEKVTENKIEIEGNPYLSPDGLCFISRSATMFNLEMRSSQTGEKIGEYIGSKAKILDFDVNDEFSVMVSIDKEHIIRVWDIKTRKVMVGIRIADAVGENEKIRILRGCKHAIITNDTKDNLIRIIDLATGRVVRTMTGDEMSWSHATAAHPLRRSNEFLIVKNGGNAEVWRMQETSFKSGLSVSRIFKTELRIEQEAKFCEHMALARMHLGKRQIKDALSNLDIARNVPGFEYADECLALRDELIPYCEIVGLRKLRVDVSYKGHRSPVLFSAISMNGKLAVSGCGRTADKMASLWDAKTGDIIKPLQETVCSEAAAFCDDDNFLLGNYKSILRVSLYTTQTEMFDGTKRTQFHYKFLEKFTCSEIVSYIKYFPNNRTFASACKSNTQGLLFGLKLWIPEQSCNELDLFKNTFKCVAFTSNGSKSYLGLKEQKIIMIDTKTGVQKDFAAVEAHTISVSSDDKYVAAGSDDGGVKILSTADGSVVTSIKCDSKINVMSFASSCQYLVCACDNGTVNMFDIHGRALCKTEPGQYPSMISLSIGPNDLFILTGGIDGRLHRWDLDWTYEPRS